MPEINHCIEKPVSEREKYKSSFPFLAQDLLDILYRKFAYLLQCRKCCNFCVLGDMKYGSKQRSEMRMDSSLKHLEESISELLQKPDNIQLLTNGGATFKTYNSCHFSLFQHPGVSSSCQIDSL